MGKYDILAESLGKMLDMGQFEECLAVSASLMHDEKGILYDIGIGFVDFLIRLKDSVYEEKKITVIGYIAKAAAVMSYPTEKYEDIYGFSLMELWHEYTGLLSEFVYSGDIPDAEVIRCFAQLGISADDMIGSIMNKLEYSDASEILVQAACNGYYCTHGIYESLTDELRRKTDDIINYGKRFSAVMQMLIITHPEFSEKFDLLKEYHRQGSYESILNECFWNIGLGDVLSEKESDVLQKIGRVAEKAENISDMKTYSRELTALYSDFLDKRDICGIIFGKTAYD